MRYLILIITLLLAGCSSTLPSVSPYKMEITQGNIVTSKMLAQLKPGMSKSQVKFIVGTPLIQDMFHKDRWDYYLQQIIDGKITEQRRVIIDFKDDKLINVSGDVIPVEKGDIADASAGYKFTKEDPQVIAPSQTTAAKADESSWTDKLMFWKENKTDADKAALKKQIEAHNQSLLDKQAESRIAAENSKPETTLPVEAAVIAAPIAAAAVAPLAAVPDPVVTAPSVEISAPANTPETAIEPASVSATDVKPTDIRVMEANPVPAETSLPRATPQPIAIAPVAATPVAEAIAEVVPAPTPATASNTLLRLSENLENYVDMPLNNPFASSEPEPLGLQLTNMITLANQAVIEKTNLEINSTAEEAAKAAEKAKEEPSFFERMLERVGF